MLGLRWHAERARAGYRSRGPKTDTGSCRAGFEAGLYIAEDFGLVGLPQAGGTDPERARPNQKRSPFTSLGYFPTLSGIYRLYLKAWTVIHTPPTFSR